jgi:glutamine amidotransferase
MSSLNENVAIIDYGVGNIASLESALKRINIRPTISGNPEILANFDRFIMPGVGAFGVAMRKLCEKNLDSFVIDMAKEGKNLMGICVGMQILFERGLENGNHPGLALLSGEVVELPDTFPTKPNTGWWGTVGDWSQFSAELSREDTFYFVHSFHCKLNEKIQSLNIDSDHNIVACVKKNNIWGTQFHPEKSQKSGEKILMAFLGN